MQRGELQLQDLGPEPQKGLRRGLWCFAMLALAALIAVVFIERYGEQSTLLEGEQRETDNLARAFAHHAARTVGETDRVLISVADDLALQPGLANDEAALHALLRSRIETAPELVSLTVADAEGRLLASTVRYPIGDIS